MELNESRQQLQLISEKCVQALAALSLSVCLSAAEVSSQQQQEFPNSSFKVFETQIVKMREIVHIQAGQCGNQIGAKVSRHFVVFQRPIFRRCEASMQQR